MKSFICSHVKLWLAFTLTAAFIFSQPVVSQNIVVEPADNEIIVLRLNENTGTLLWQVSPDGEDWSDVSKGTADTLEISAGNSPYYRGKVTVPGCCEYYTDTVQILADSLESRRMVVAHYMIGMVTYGTTVADLKKDIIDAHDQGVEAFQININGWRIGNNKLLTAKMYQAASECDFPFYLFLSAGFNVNVPVEKQWSYEDISNSLQLYANHPKYLHIDGRPLFSTWLGDQKGVGFWRTIKQRLNEEHGIDIFYVPWYGYYFNYKGNTTNVISSERMEELLNEWEGIIDGFWYWGVARSPFPVGTETGIIPSTSIPSGGEILSNVLKNHGMPFMTPIAPAFWATCKEPCKYTEFEGGKGVESQWMSIINKQDARWVNLVTWNDMGEDTYWSPYPDPGLSPRRTVYSHAGYAELNKYYIKWWKTGQKPAIEKDKIFYFYRTQFYDAVPLIETCTFNCSKPLPDKIYVTTMLVSPAELTIYSGTKTTVYDAPAGIYYWETDIGEGTQRFTLIRDGKRVIDATGGKPVERTPEYKSWSLFSGFAEEPEH